MKFCAKCNFHKNLILKINSISYENNNLIPKKWQLILMSDGSFTQTLTSLTGKKIKINIIEQYHSQLNNNITKTREVWLEDYNNTKLAFAKSLWPLYNEIELTNYKPIGQSLIEYKADIYRDIHEIYYGYSEYLEYEFNCKGPIWGRKYSIYYKKRYLTTLEEYFAPKIINFFNE